MSGQEAPTTPFVDWYGIWAGHGGVGRDGLSWIQDPPVGDLRLKVQPGRWSEPIFDVPEHPWEAGGIVPNFVFPDDGKLKVWYQCKGDDGTSHEAYAESTDGYAWHKPELGLVEYNGSKANNLLHPTEYFWLRCVFRDPTAPPEERYKSTVPRGLCFVDGVANPELTGKHLREMRAAMLHEGMGADQIHEKLRMHQLIMGAVSPDGLRWTVLEEPLRDLGSLTLDGEYFTTYDEERAEYVAYHRGHSERRRCIRRSTAKRFDQWEEPQFVFKPDPQDPIDVDVYSSAYCRYPHGDLHLMFLPFYHRCTSTVDVQMATSPDGLLWSRPERVPIIPRGEYESVYARRDLVALNDEEWGLLFKGSRRRHDFPTFTLDDGEEKPKCDHHHWAVWKRDRLVALEALGEARFTTVQRRCHGSQLRLNYETEAGGSVKVELVHSPVTPPKPVEPFPGFGIDQADPLVGDELGRVVSWQGKTDLSELKGQEVSLRFHLCRARLYSVSI